MSARNRLPRYCLHKPTGQAYVRIDGRFRYLGPFESPESKTRYGEIITALQLRVDRDRPLEFTVGELVLIYLEHARAYYRKNGRQTSEVACIEAVCRFLMPFRRERVADFGPLTLEAIRGEMVRAKLARTTINSQVGRIRRMIRWAVSKQLVRPDVLVALSALAPLRAGRCDAREPVPVGPVPADLVDAVLPRLSAPLRAVVEVLRLTGARTGEILSMRIGEIDRSLDPWEYRPRSHKTEHKGKRRVILIGPKAQEIITPLLRADPSAYIFRPRKSFQERYHSQAVRKAVARVITKLNKERANEELPPLAAWHPHQLRHSAATRLKRDFGREVAQTVLGHAKPDMTDLYAERDLTAARRVVATIG